MWVLVGLLLGIILGFFSPYQIPVSISRYVSVGFLAGLDAVLGGTRAGLEERFDLLIFISGFVVNVLVAVLVTWVGDALGADLYLAAVAAFGLRIFGNLGPIRRRIVGRTEARDQASQRS